MNLDREGSDSSDSHRRRQQDQNEEDDVMIDEEEVDPDDLKPEQEEETEEQLEQPDQSPRPLPVVESEPDPPHHIDAGNMVSQVVDAVLTYYMYRCFTSCGLLR